MTDRYLFFSNKELKCHCGKCSFGQNDMDPFFMSKLIELRMDAGFPFPATSAFRCIDYDKKLNGSGIHSAGHAIDIAVYGHRAYWIITHAGKYFTGIGIKQTGPCKGRFIHLDDAYHSIDHPRPWVWTY